MEGLDTTIRINEAELDNIDEYTIQHMNAPILQAAEIQNRIKKV